MMSNFLMEMKKAAIEANSSIENSFHALSFMETDFKYFLLNFFKDNVNQNLFLTHIFYRNNDGMNNFQSIVFEKSCSYFSKLINIDDLSFYYDSTIPLSSIDLILSDTKIASINIFHRELVLYEGVFFEEIDRGIDRKTIERDKLVDSYNKKVQSLNDFSIFSSNNEYGLAKSAINNIILKNKTKKERLTDLEFLNLEILEVENEISELMITRNMLIRNLSNIKYFQEKIQNRICLNLKYKVKIN